MFSNNLNKYNKSLYVIDTFTQTTIVGHLTIKRALNLLTFKNHLNNRDLIFLIVIAPIGNIVSEDDFSNFILNTQQIY